MKCECCEKSEASRVVGGMFHYCLECAKLWAYMDANKEIQKEVRKAGKKMCDKFDIEFLKFLKP